MTSLRSCARHRSAAGFSLVELLLAASLGTVLCGVFVQLLLGDLRFTGAMAQRLQARRIQQRTIALMRAERELGHALVTDPPLSSTWPCNLAGRRPVLALALSAHDPEARQQAIVYTVGKPPSAIWRGEVLMRCGPAYGLDGQINLNSRFQNRVLLDGLPAGEGKGLLALPHPQLPVVAITLEQELPASGRADGSTAIHLSSRAAL